MNQRIETDRRMMRGGLRRFAPWLGRRDRHLYYPTPWVRLRRLLGWLQARAPSGLLALQLMLTVLALVHLALVFLFPAGRNAFLDVDLTGQLPHLTLWRPGDAFGFPTESAPRGFIRYAVFAQNGQVQQGEFPNPQVRPDLRYSRWAAAGNVVSRNQPALHDALLRFLLENFGSSPLRVDLYAGEWEPDGALAPRGGGGAGAAGVPERIAERMRIWKLGTHDGLTRTWKPATRASDK